MYRDAQVLPTSLATEKRAQSHVKSSILLTKLRSEKHRQSCQPAPGCMASSSEYCGPETLHGGMVMASTQQSKLIITLPPNLGSCISAVVQPQPYQAAAAALSSSPTSTKLGLPGLLTAARVAVPSASYRKSTRPSTLRQAVSGGACSLLVALDSHERSTCTGPSRCRRRLLAAQGQAQSRHLLQHLQSARHRRKAVLGKHNRRPLACRRRCLGGQRDLAGASARWTDSKMVHAWRLQLPGAACVDRLLSRTGARLSVVRTSCRHRSSAKLRFSALVSHWLRHLCKPRECAQPLHEQYTGSGHDAACWAHLSPAVLQSPARLLWETSAC